MGKQQPNAARALSWEAPADWVASSRDVPMRLATYYVGGEGDGADADADHGRLEVAVTAFPGEVGGTLGNVNRWRDQLGLDAITQTDLDNYLVPFGGAGEVHGWTLRLDAETQTTGPDGMLAALIHSPEHDHTWFVRAFGDTAQLDAHEADVRAFAQTFHVAELGAEGDSDDEPAHAHAHAHSQDHHGAHGQSSIDGAYEATEATDGDHAVHPMQQGAGAGELVLEPPADWRPVERSSSIVYASYEVGPPENRASIAVTPLAGDAGGLFANVNMWRQQLGLPGVADVDEQPIERIDVDGRAGKLVVVEAEEAGLVAVILPEGDRTWFFRMSGPADIVNEQRENFERFVRGARFAEP